VVILLILYQEYDANSVNRIFLGGDAVHICPAGARGEHRHTGHDQSRLEVCFGDSRQGIIHIARNVWGSHGPSSEICSTGLSTNNGKYWVLGAIVTMTRCHCYYD
jgi:hypothetical protein